MSTEAHVAECLCEDPTTHPEGDTVRFLDKLDFRLMATARATVAWTVQSGEGSEPEIMAALTEFYLLHCIESWTLKTGKHPVPVTKDSIRERILSNTETAFRLADVADNLYSAVVILPLVQAASASSKASPIDKSTSAQNGNGKSRKHSKQSLTSTTPMVATATTPS